MQGAINFGMNTVMHKADAIFITSIAMCWFCQQLRLATHLKNPIVGWEAAWETADSIDLFNSVARQAFQHGLFDLLCQGGVRSVAV